jgi:hypothetical protein
MPEPKQYEKKLPHQKLNTEWAQFYQALGTFNTNIVARVIKDPTRVREVTKDLVAWCPVHDAQCADGFVYDHINNRCIMLTVMPGEE